MHTHTRTQHVLDVYHGPQILALHDLGLHVPRAQIHELDGDEPQQERKRQEAQANAEVESQSEGERRRSAYTHERERERARKRLELSGMHVVCVIHD